MSIENLLIVKKFCANQQRTMVSIGIPVYNGAHTMAAVLDSLLTQSFINFELIISDNCSTDSTQIICESYAKRDPRIRYIRQLNNFGAGVNFKYVLDAARGHYFMWAASDDFRTQDFLAENVAFLESHPDYVASTSPNRLEGQDQRITFSMTGTLEQRFRAFFDNCWSSHGIFYSVMRTEVIRQCPVVGRNFLAADWAIDLFLASHGNIHRTEKGLTIFGVHGVSSRSGFYRAFRQSSIERFLPFYRMSLYTLKLTAHRPLKVRMQYLKILFKLNMRAVYSQFHAEFYPAYSRKIRPWIHKLRGKKSCNS